MRIPSDSAHNLFGRQLMGVCRVLNIVPPIFKGRELPSDVPNVHRWEIETEILPRPIGTPTEPIIFRKEYTTWETGLLLAMHEALARICETYYELLPQTSPYRVFGRRDAEGLPYYSDGDREHMGLMQIHLEDLELLAHRTETILRADMGVLDQAKELIEQQRVQIEIAEELAEAQEAQKQKLMEDKQKLEAENLKLGNKVDQQHAMIAALQEQCACLAKESAGEQSEEDPKERVMYTTDGEEVSVEEWKARKTSSGQKRRKTEAAVEFLARIQDE